MSAVRQALRLYGWEAPAVLVPMDDEAVVRRRFGQDHATTKALFDQAVRPGLPLGTAALRAKKSRRRLRAYNWRRVLACWGDDPRVLAALDGAHHGR